MTWPTPTTRAQAQKIMAYLKRMDWHDYEPAIEHEFAKVIDRAEKAEAEAAALREAKPKLTRALETALRQWRMYAEMEPERDLSVEDSPEASLYRACKNDALTALKEPDDAD